MADNNLYNNKDSLDISELASLNEDISNDLIEQLQMKVQKDADIFSPSKVDDSTLFEEVNENESQEKSPDSVPMADKKENFKLDSSINDNFIKKYKAKLNKQAANQQFEESSVEQTAQPNEEKKEEIPEDAPIEKITNGNITEKIITKEQKQYNDSLDFLDGNVKYSKYVIYIDPQNVDFIEGLTVKERKNLINNILKQQNDISVSKQRFKVIQNIIAHAIITILTITISIPVIYHAINSSLEASINNYRRSQTNFQTLYKEKGKITNLHNK